MLLDVLVRLLVDSVLQKGEHGRSKKERVSQNDRKPEMVKLSD